MSLANANLLTPLTRDELARLNLTVNTRIFIKGETIVPRNTLLTHIYFVLNGRAVETATTFGGKEFIFDTYESGDCFGLLAMVSETYSRADVIASEKCEIAAIKTNLLREISENNTGFNSKLMKEFTRTINKLGTRLYEMRELNVSQRTRNELLKYAIPVTMPRFRNKEFALIEGLPTHEEIANTIFTHREAVTKEIKKLRDSGVLINYGKNGYVVQLNKLCVN